MVGGTKLPPQDSESGPWLNEHKAKARATPRATPKPKPSSKGKRKTFRLVHVSLDNADTVIEGGPRFDLTGITNTVGCPVLRVLGEGRESEMPAPSGFDHVSTTKSNGTRSIAAHPFDNLRAGPCKKTQGWGTLGGNGARKDC
jgi:hypothetical protein